MPDFGWKPKSVIRAGQIAALLPLAREAAKTLGPMLSPAVQSARDRVVAQRSARKQAAGLTEGSYAPVYVGPAVHYVVWAGDRPVNAFPPVPPEAGGLAGAVQHVDLEKRRRPGDPSRRSLRLRRRRGGEEDAADEERQEP